jgi:hypothetical protein
MAAKIATIIVSMGLAARDRVFSAYCEQVGDPTVIGWGPVVCADVDAFTTGGGYTKFFDNPAGQINYLRIVSANTSKAGRGVSVVFGTAAAAVSGLGAFGTGFSAVPYEAGPFGQPTWTALWFTPTVAYDYTGTVCFQVGALGGTETHTPTPQPLPEGLLSPLRPVDPTLDGIAAEMASLEFKLDTLLTILQAVAGDTLDLGGDAGDPTDLAPDTPLDLANSAGAVLSASGIPASRSLDFGTPQNIVKLAKINVGNVDGWYPSVWMTHTPFVLRPLPQGVTKLTVTDITPGVSITSRLISKTK